MILQEELGEEQLISLSDNDKTLGDTLALTVGRIRENIKLKRAIRYKASDDINVFGAVHPPTSTNTGKYGSLLALKCARPDDIITNQLCIHIIGKF